ncbi:MAG TPA: chorismate mutase [Gemmatimonadales bacterium]|nr:chorismate mutase [Gemmatimonadales bacterium]
MIRHMVSRALRIPSLRAIRGATSVADDTPEQIAVAVDELLMELRQQNSLDHREVVSAIFTVTPDLVSAFPAGAARASGWSGVPLLCTTEIPVPDGMPRCLRVMLHVERYWNGSSPRHVYLREATALRPDLAGIS